MRPRSSLRAWAAVSLVLLVGLAGCDDTRSTENSDEPNAAKGQTPTATRAAERTAGATTKERPQTGTRSEQARSTSAAAALQALPVKGRAPKTGYSREQYGSGWLSV